MALRPMSLAARGAPRRHALAASRSWRSSKGGGGRTRATQVEVNYDVVREAAATFKGGRQVHMAGFMAPRRDKVATGGEDAFFVDANGSLAVADGVSGWGEVGVDPAKYSRALVQLARAALAENNVEDPLAALDAAHLGTALPGAATALVACLKEGALRVAVLGDCGFRVVRGGRVVLASDARQHSFDCPFQLASAKLGYTTDSAKDAVAYEVFLEPGDVVVAGSDGIWDNVGDDELAKVVLEEGANAARSADDCQRIAKQLAQVAQAHSTDTSFDSPYRQAAKREMAALEGDGTAATDGTSDVAKAKAARAKAGEPSVTDRLKNMWESFNSTSVQEEEKESLQRSRQASQEGGKPDDITVVVAVVQQ